MKRRPYPFAIALAGAPMVGFVGLMVAEGWWTWALFAVAACPVALGAFGHFRPRRA